MSRNDLDAAALAFIRLSRMVTEMTNEAKRTLAREVVKTVVPTTPVLTGKARSNWLASNGFPLSRINSAPQISLSGAPSFAALERAILGARPGVDMYIQNSLPYIRRLNAGYSRQAPAKYVEAQVDLAASMFPAAFAAVVRRRGLP